MASSLNLVTIRCSNGDAVVTRVVINGNHARAYVAPDADVPALTPGGKKSRPPRQTIPVVTTQVSACYSPHAGFRSCRRPSLIRHHPTSR